MHIQLTQDQTREASNYHLALVIWPPPERRLSRH